MVIVESDGELNCAVDDSESGSYAAVDGLYNDMTEQPYGLEYTLYGYKASPSHIQDYVAYSVEDIVWFSGDISNCYVSVSYMTENGQRAESFYIEKPSNTSDINVSRPQLGSALPFPPMRTFGNSFLDDTDWITDEVDLLNPTMADAEYKHSAIIQSGHYADALRTEIDRDGFPIIGQGEFNIKDKAYYLCGRKVTEDITPSHALDNECQGQVIVT